MAFPHALLVLVALTAPISPRAREETLPRVVARSAEGAALARVVREPRRPGGLELEVLAVTDRGERRLWRAPWTARAADPVLFLTESGDALASVEPRYAREGELVELWRRGLRIAALDADALGLSPVPEELALDEAGRWIAPAWDTTRLRRIAAGQGGTEVLDLLTVAGELVTIDLANGWVERSGDGASGRGASIEPALPSEVAGQAIEPYAERLVLPASGVAGRALELEIAGSFPTPGFAIVGYTLELERRDEEGLDITLHPWASSLGGGPAARVITHFRTRAALVVNEPGTHRVRVLGRDESDPPPPSELRILPARLAVQLAIEEPAREGTPGGVRRYELRTDGRWMHAGRTRLASPAAMRALSSALAALPAEPAPRRSPFGSDLQVYRLTWVRDGEPREAVLDERTLAGPYRALVEAVLALERDRPPGPPRWTISADEGRLVVKTRSAGLLEGLGHDHEIDAPGRSGELRFDPERPSEASLELVVDAASLVPLGEKDREEIRANMRTKVLEVTRFPRLAYRARRIDAKEIGEGRYEAVLHGELELHGVTKPLVVGARVVLEGERLVASGKLTLRLRDFAIDPPSAGLGTVKVADELAIEFDLVAERTP